MDFSSSKRLGLLSVYDSLMFQWEARRRYHGILWGSKLLLCGIRDDNRKTLMGVELTEEAGIGFMCTVLGIASKSGMWTDLLSLLENLFTYFGVIPGCVFIYPKMYYLFAF